ncbi:MAG TPA: isoprenylcysteine carboxylmethyltransferase family protein [Pyrinomonadaceae bacterium]|nr:isoprenylcysteine carboxylmethyltransferase family protein [Pyrinomonadaceae bacterium]
MNGQTNWLPVSDYALHATVFAVVFASWFAFALVFILFLKRKPPEATESRRDSTSKLGIALQGASYAFVWAFMRERFTHIAPLGRIADIVVAVVTIALAVGSVWLVMSAVGTLGKQWSLTARVVEGHKLITSGAYARVRHPIYTGMFGMLLATGLAATHWAGLVAGLIVFWMGTIIRVRSEERLLRATFGADYDDYARRVPAVLPGIY